MEAEGIKGIGVHHLTMVIINEGKNLQSLEDIDLEEVEEEVEEEGILKMVTTNISSISKWDLIPAEGEDEGTQEVLLDQRILEVKGQPRLEEDISSTR